GGERQRGCICLDELDVRELRGARARLREQLRDAIDADDFVDERSEREGQRSGPGADVERTLLSGGQHEGAHYLGQLGGAFILARRDEVRGLREAVRRR